MVAHAKALEREEVGRLKAECTSKAAMVPRRRESRRDQVSTVAESAEAQQIKSHPAQGGRGEEVSNPNVNMQAQQGEFSFFNQHSIAYASPSHGQFVFNSPVPSVWRTFAIYVVVSTVSHASPLECHASIHPPLSSCKFASSAKATSSSEKTISHKTDVADQPWPLGRLHAKKVLRVGLVKVHGSGRPWGLLSESMLAGLGSWLAGNRECS